MSLPVFSCNSASVLLGPEQYLRNQILDGVPQPACQIEGAVFESLVDSLEGVNPEFRVRAHLPEADVEQLDSHPMVQMLSRIALVGFSDIAVTAKPPQTVLFVPQTTIGHRDPYFSNLVNLTLAGTRETTVVDPTHGQASSLTLIRGCLSVIPSRLTPFFPLSHQHHVDGASPDARVLQLKHSFRGRDIRAAA